MQQLSFDDLEVWKPVVGHEGSYEVSSTGLVRSMARTVRCGNRLMRVRERILKTATLPRSGHLHVNISAAGVQHRAYVHRLVAAAFLGPCPAGQEVRHKDGNPANNRLSNLAYGTHAENMHDMVLHGRNYWGRRTHCGQGHELTPENVLARREKLYTGRRCRRCARDYSRARRAHAKEIAA